MSPFLTVPSVLCIFAISIFVYLMSHRLRMLARYQFTAEQRAQARNAVRTEGAGQADYQPTHPFGCFWYLCHPDPEELTGYREYYGWALTRTGAERQTHRALTSTARIQ
ncbi:hypothetical protein GCM10010156_49560 [Planobispora rosea]|uniref:Uncharacterized protein n=1 Tax=Planobispora rosea TaxID=35762 RepID=A0A8J3S2G0_PLARO|nr:hypothetical protein [Planobispora rosea]GGS85040.1 hypothetical protein GCM10010156_49560 [Planobispora rosea]GIH86467.1 hypothetical protein Pro02_48750 [Planobispora rosea]